MLYIAHRVNTVAQLRRVPNELGVEIDLRDQAGRLVLQHEPYESGEEFEDWLSSYRHRLLVLNVKCERIEPRVLELIRAARVTDYFFLDCSFPMIHWLMTQGERRIAVRYSELEPVESAEALAGRVDWVWIDCFTRMPLDPRTYARLKRHFKLCGVSPELQGRDVAQITDYRRQLAPYLLDAVCTKRPDLWQSALMAA